MTVREYAALSAGVGLLIYAVQFAYMVVALRRWRFPNLVLVAVLVTGGVILLLEGFGL